MCVCNNIITVYTLILIQAGETAYTVAKGKGFEKVCEELQPSDMKKQPVVRSDSAQHKFTVSFHIQRQIMFNLMSSLYLWRRNFKALELLYLDGCIKRTTKLEPWVDLCMKFV